MKYILSLFSLILFLQCKKKESLSDGVTFSYDKSIPMKFQEFNELNNEYNGDLIYFGQKKSSIPLKYYLKGLRPPPFHPEDSISKKTKSDLVRDSLFQKYFNGYLSYDFDYRNQKFDSINNQNFQIDFNVKDTIPKYTIGVETNKLKSYKAMPIFIKNISGKNLRIKTYNVVAVFQYLTPDKKWKTLLNYPLGGEGCFDIQQGLAIPKDNLMIFGIPYFHGNQKIKMRIRFGDAYSDTFDGFVDPEVLRKQR